jgi:hypothetical protein
MESLVIIQFEKFVSPTFQNNEFQDPQKYNFTRCFGWV